MRTFLGLILFLAAGYYVMSSGVDLPDVVNNLINHGTSTVGKYCTFRETVVQDGIEIDLYNCGEHGIRSWLVEENSWQGRS